VACVCRNLRKHTPHNTQNQSLDITQLNVGPRTRDRAGLRREHQNYVDDETRACGVCRWAQMGRTGAKGSPVHEMSDLVLLDGPCRNPRILADIH